MTTTTREVILRIKTEQARSMGRQQSDPKAMAGNMASFAKELKAATPIVERHTAAMQKYAVALRQVGDAMARLNRTQNLRQPTMTGSTPGSSQGSGLGMLGGIIPGGMALALGHTLVSTGLAAWGSSRHGTPMMDGAFGPLDTALNATSGRGQRQWLVEQQMADTDRRLEWRKNVLAAGTTHLAGTQQLETASMSGSATDQDRLNLLGQQQEGWRNTLAFHRRQAATWGRELETNKANLETDYQNRIAQLKKDARGPLGLFAAANTGTVNLETDAKLSQLNIDYAKKMNDNLAEQKMILEKLLSNEQQQLEIAKGMAAKQQEGAVSLGGLTPTEQRAATQALQTLNAGGTISGDEQAILGKAGPVGQRALRDAYFRNAGPEYANFMQAGQQGGYVSPKEIQQFQQGQQATNLLQGGLGALGVSLPTVEVNLTMNEQLLAKAIMKEAQETLAEIKDTMVNIAQQVFDLKKEQQNIRNQTQVSATNFRRGGVP